MGPEFHHFGPAFLFLLLQGVDSLSEQVDLQGSAVLEMIHELVRNVDAVLEPTQFASKFFFFLAQVLRFIRSFCNKF